MPAHDNTAFTTLLHAETFPGLRTLRASDVQVRLWEEPTFHPWVSWTLIGSSIGLTCRRLTWRRDGAQNVPEPVIIGADAIIDWALWRTLRAELTPIVIAPFDISDGNGRDGSRYGIELGMLTSARLIWWQSAPDRWPGLDAWWRKAVDTFERHLPPRTNM